MIAREGKIEIEVFEGKISKELPVFYNPQKKFDRDVSIEVLKYVLPKNANVLDMLSASGVFGLRIASELETGIVYLNDKNPKAVELMKRNVERNRDVLKADIKISNYDARKIAGKLEEKFDYIDIDPFGSPVPFLPSAFLLIKHKGIISVTATDTGALYGTYKNACIRKYNSIPLKISESHEIGLRILIKRIVEIASMYNIGIDVIFSYWYRHIYRVFFRILKGKTHTKRSLEKIAFFKWENGWKFYPIWEGRFEDKVYGPIWVGKLWDQEIAEKLGEKFKELKELREEYKIPTEYNIHYNIHRICKEFKIGMIKKKREVIESLRKRGYLASPTIFSGTGVRTNAEFEVIKEILSKNQ